MTSPNRARDLLRYMTASKWEEYRSILAVFVDRPVPEFTPEDISLRTGIDPDTAQVRMQHLREWGNLAEATSTKNPTSLEDYYRRSRTYLITTSGQDTFAAVENVLAKAGRVDDLQSGRLRTLRVHLENLISELERGADPSDTVQAVFDTHLLFAGQLRNFSAELNVWQRRYDLDVEEVPILADVLIGYFAQRLQEIDREVPRISQKLEYLQPFLPKLVARMGRSGLAARVDSAGLGSEISVQRRRGTKIEDWMDLRSWFASSRRSSEVGRITEHALLAVNTLTANLIRFSRSGSAEASRRADFLRLAGFFHHSATDDQAHYIAGAAFGLGSCRHLGYSSSDINDPCPITTPWRDAPKAEVPMSLRKRGDIAQRGRMSRIRDRKEELRHMRDVRQRAHASRQKAISELTGMADSGDLDGCSLSIEASQLLLNMISSATSGGYADYGIRCEIRRDSNFRTTIETTEGWMIIRDRTVALVSEEA